jgi:phenylpropionate dioxygenase-like ring-hydroxylating dioxygenase large terminal subunit
MAGWSRDFPATGLDARTLLEEPLVFFRLSSGQLVAFEDRCCHRLAPLSHGQLEGDSLRCLYHGLRFAPDGRCIEIPGKTTVPKALQVRTFPVIEKYSAAWIWMGEPALADESLIPDFVGVDDPTWAMLPGRMDYEANHHLIHDNLLDLSHVAYVHRKSFGEGNRERNEAWAKASVQITELPRGMRFSRWIEGAPSPPHSAAQGPQVDVFTRYDYLVPGVLLLSTGYYPTGTAPRYRAGETLGTPIFDSFTCQAVTPLTAKSSCYFFAFGPRAQHANMKEAFRDLGIKAFTEDRIMIEAQQKVINADPARKMTLIDLDKGPVMYWRLVDRMLREESASMTA